MSNSILIDMADLLLQAEQRSRDDESDSDEEIAGTAEASSDINQRRNSTRRSDIFIAPASSRAIPSAPRPSLDDSTSNSLAAWREPRQHLRDRDLLSSEFQYEIDLPSLREGEEDNATGQKSGKGVRKMQNSPCLAGLLPACISQSKASSSAASWRRGSDDLESSLPPGEDVDNVPDDRLLPSVRDAEFVRMAVCLLAASFNFSLDIVLMALLWTSLIIPGAAVATFLIFLPPFLGGIALFLAIRKGWGQGLFNDPLLSLLPFAIVILDAITLVMLPSIYFSTSGLNKSCKSQARLILLEVALRDHWSCRTTLVLCFQAIPMVILKCILLGLCAGSTSTALQAILGISLASSLIYIACFVTIEFWSNTQGRKPVPQTAVSLIKRARHAFILRLSYKGGQGESQSVVAGAGSASKMPPRVTFVAPSIPHTLQDRVAAFRRNAQINLDDLELPGLHRLQKRKLMELAVLDRPRLLIANSLVASTSCVSAANNTLRLTSKVSESSHKDNAGAGISRPSNYPLRKPRQTLLAIPSLSALQRLTSYCLPPALTPFLSDSLPAVNAEREILLSLVSYEDAALPESHPYMECLLSSVLNSIGPSSASRFTFGPSCLTTMMIKGTRLSPKCIDLLTSALLDEACSQRLSTLILSEAGFSPSAFATVCDAIGRNRSLRYLDLSCYKPGLSGAQALGAMLSTNKGLVEVNLSYMGLVSSSAGMVLLGAGKSSSLQKLDLSQNHVKDDAPLLEHLVPEESPIFASMSNHHGSSLKHLDLSFNWIEDGAAAWLLLILELIPSLKHLNLGHNSYTASSTTQQQPSRQTSSASHTTPNKRHQSGQSGTSQNLRPSHSGHLLACAGQIEERESRNRGFAFIAHLLSFCSQGTKGRAKSLLSRLEQLETLDIRGMVLPAWFSIPGGSDLRPSCLVATVHKNPSVFKGSGLLTALSEKTYDSWRESAGASLASSRRDSGESGGESEGEMNSQASRKDRSDPLMLLFPLPPTSSESIRGAPSRQRTLDRLESQGAWQAANTVPEEEEEGEGGEGGVSKGSKRSRRVEALVEESKTTSLSRGKSLPKKLGTKELNVSTDYSSKTPPSLPLLPPEIQLPRPWIRRLTKPGAVLDMNEKEWRRLSRGQQTCALYLFFESQQRILVSNVCRKAREALLKQLFLSPQLSRLISEAAPIMFPFQAESPLDSQPPPPDGFLDDAQYLEINSMDAHFVSSRGAPSSRCTPELVGSLSLRASDTGQRYSIIHKSSSTVFESATSNLMTDGEVEPRRPLSSHELSDEDQQQPLNIFPLLRLQPSMNLAAAASPTPSQPLSSYKLGIASSRQLRKMKTAASASQRWRSMRGKSQGLKDNTADSAPALAMHGFLSFHHPTSPCASLLATGVTDGQVVGAPGRALGLLYGPSSTVDHMSAESLATRPITRSNTQREAQAVLLIGSAESSPVLRILPRLLEMPLLARLQSKEGEPLVMELLLRGLTDQQVEAFEWFVAVVRLFAARHQCVPLIEEVV